MKFFYVFKTFFLFLRSFSFFKKSYPHLFTPVIDLHHSEISYTVQCDFILSEALAYAHVDWDIGASPGCYVVPCCNYRILSGVACQRKASACCLTGRLSVPSFFSIFTQVRGQRTFRSFYPTVDTLVSLFTACR